MADGLAELPSHRVSATCLSEEPQYAIATSAVPSINDCSDDKALSYRKLYKCKLLENGVSNTCTINNTNVHLFLTSKVFGVV